MMTGRQRKPYVAQTEDFDIADEDEYPLDEQEQEDLIANLRIEDESRNKFFIIAFTCLALFPTIFHLSALIHGTFTLLDLLSLSSLGMTTYTLHRIPLPASSFLAHPLSVIFSSAAPSDDESEAGSDASGEYNSDLNPTQRFLPYLNPVLVGVLTVKAWTTSRSRFDHDRDYWFLPLVVWGLVVVGRWTMGRVDVGELEKLRYKYKGA